MRKILSILFLLSALALKAQNNFEIKGTGLSTDKAVTLKVFSATELKYLPLETLELGESKSFTFTSELKGANLYELNFDGKHAIHLSVENLTTIAVIRSKEGDQIEGSPSSERMIAFEKQNQQLQQKHFGALKKAVDEAMKANDREKLNELQAQSKDAIQKFLVEFRQLIVGMGTTPAAYHAIQFSDFNKELAFIESRLVAFQKESPNAVTTKALERQVYQAKVTGIGKTPPAIEAKGLDDEMISLDQYKGKITLVDFWAAWCRACRIENPKFVELYMQHKNQGFEILSISQDKTKEAWKAAIEEDGIGAWKHIWDKDRSITKMYSVSSLPQNVVLDREGKIIAKNVSAEQLTQLLLKIL